MCQNSSMQLVRLWVWVSITMALDWSTWRVRAEGPRSLFFRAWWCYRRWWSVWPIKVREHLVHGMLYTTPFLWFAGTGSLGFTSSCHMVLKRWKVIWMSRGANTLRMDSENPVISDQTVGRCASVWTSWGTHCPGRPVTLPHFLCTTYPRWREALCSAQQCP